MFKRIVILVCALQIANPALGCEFSKDIQRNEDGTYTYTRDCHVEVGKKLDELDIRLLQIEDLKSSLDLKDLALQKSEERIELWRETSFKLEDRVNKIEKYKSQQQWYWFALGIVVTGAAVWSAGQLND